MMMGQAHVRTNRNRFGRFNHPSLAFVTREPFKHRLQPIGDPDRYAEKAFGRGMGRNCIASCETAQVATLSFYPIGKLDNEI